MCACVSSYVCTVRSVRVPSCVCTARGVPSCACTHVITCVHCAVCGCVPARVSTMQSVHVSPITCVHRVFKCHTCVAGSAGDVCPGATAETPAGRGLGGPLQAAPEPPTPQTGSGVLVPGRPHLRQAGGGDGAGSPQGAPCVSAQSRRGLIPGPPAPPRRGLRRRRSGRGRQAAGSGQPSPGCCRVLPASPRAGGAGPREEITERPFAYCENCTGERRRQRLQNNMLFSRACQVARKPSSRLSPRSRGPRRGRGGGSGLPHGCRLGPGWGVPRQPAPAPCTRRLREHTAKPAAPWAAGLPAALQTTR